MELFSASGTYFPVLSIQVIESLDYFSAMIRITSTTPPNDSEFTVPLVQGGTSESFMVFMTHFNDNVYVTYLYPKKFYAMYKNLFAGYTGYATVESLASSVGFTYNGPKSLKTYWDLPKMSLQKLLKLLTKYASIEGGGAPHFYINLNGNVQCVDYKYSIDKMAPDLVVGTLTSSKMSTEWYSQIPGDFRFIKFFPDGTSVENYTVQPNTMFSQVSCYFSTRDASNTINQVFSNQFYEYYYSTNVAEVSLEYGGNFGIGTTVALDSNGIPFVVRSRTTTFQGEESATQELQIVAGINTKK